MRSLNVRIAHRQVGILFVTQELWTFGYEESWTKDQDSFDLSPALPRTRLTHVDSGSYRPVQWYFDNLLPEGLLRLAMAQEAKIQPDNEFALLAYLGAESAGALIFVSPWLESPSESVLQEITDVELHQRIFATAHQTLTKSSLKRGALAGEAHKLPLVMLGDKMYEPRGATPSTHILKSRPMGASTGPASAFNEFVTMQLAGAAGLLVPEVNLRYVPEPVFIIKRFDRMVRSGKRQPRLGSSAAVVTSVVQLRHVIDGCQLLNMSRDLKHEGASLQSLLEIIELTNNKIDTRLRLFQWLVFNILVGNSGCHLKDLSFFMSRDGVALAPNYGLSAAGVYETWAVAGERAIWGKVPLAFPLPDANYFEDVTLNSVLRAAEKLGLHERSARRIVKEVTTRVPKALVDLNAKLVQRTASLPLTARGLLAEEAKILDVLEHSILRDMLDRLKDDSLKDVSSLPMTLPTKDTVRPQ